MSIFTISCRFSPFFIDFHDLLTFVAIYALFPQFFLAKIPFSVTSHVFCMYDLKFCVHCEAQDGVDREFWKFGSSLLVCHDKGQLNRDKLLVFDRAQDSEEGEKNVLRKELQRYEYHYQSS